MRKSGQHVVVNEEKKGPCALGEKGHSSSEGGGRSGGRPVREKHPSAEKTYRKGGKKKKKGLYSPLEKRVNYPC